MQVLYRSAGGAGRGDHTSYGIDPRTKVRCKITQISDFKFSIDFSRSERSTESALEDVYSLGRAES